MKLSVVVPSIRTENLLALYNSIDIEDFEMIVVCPFLEDVPSIKENVRYIQSFKSPNACQQVGLTAATGDYVTFAADDGVFLPGALDKAMALAEEQTIVVGKYLEGDTPNPDMGKEDYYKFKYHKAYRLKGIPQDGLIFNCGIISRQFITALGGWDAENFQCTTMAHADLGIRASKVGCKMILMDEVMFKCSHQPGKSGDHKPVHNAMKKDIKVFSDMYSAWSDRAGIDINNWKNTPEVWSERFK